MQDDNNMLTVYLSIILGWAGALGFESVCMICIALITFLNSDMHKMTINGIISLEKYAKSLIFYQHVKGLVNQFDNSSDGAWGGGRGIVTMQKFITDLEELKQDPNIDKKTEILIIKKIKQYNEKILELSNRDKKIKKEQDLCSKIVSELQQNKQKYSNKFLKYDNRYFQLKDELTFLGTKLDKRVCYATTANTGLDEVCDPTTNRADPRYISKETAIKYFGYVDWP